MTTLNSATAFNWTRPTRTALIAAFAAVALAGCETGSNILGGAGNTAPQAAVTAPPQPAATQTAKIEIAPMIGAPENVSRDLQIQLASALNRNTITVATPPSGKGEYVLRGYIVAAREKTGSKISYIWDVTDQQGKRAHRITGEEFAAGAGQDPWSAITPTIVQSIADKTAAQIASWLPGSSGIPVASATPVASPASTAVAATQGAATQAVASGTTPAATPVALTTAAATPAATASTTGSIEGPASTIVPPVIGAPGDGGASLTSAIQRELTKNGVSLASVPSPQTFRVEGKVVMGTSKDGKQPIQIDWNVVDPKGKKLGTVSQKNEVPQGSLDGTWGKTADAAAQAAAQGILKLLPQQKAASN